MDCRKQQAKSTICVQTNRQASCKNLIVYPEETIMPNKDGTGPKGHGPKDGHGQGQGKGKGPGQGPMTGGKKGIKEEPKK
jgi:hypothetical protein